jgi:uncharacterized protein YkwD
MHRASALWSRRSVRYVAPLAVLTVVGLVFGRSLLGSSPDSALASAPYSAPTSAPTVAPTASAPATETAPVARTVAAPITNRGTKKGVITLAGPARAAKGSLVVFVLDGPKRVLRTDAKAPFAVKVNTRALPNGKYTVTTLVVRKGTSSVATTSTMRIKNVKAKTATKAKTAKKPAAKAPTAGGSSGSGGSGGGSTTAAGGFAAEVLSLANGERAKAGCEPMKLNGKLNAAAQGHSEDMATQNYFSHNSQDGRSPFDRMKAAGYSFSAAAENIAAGSTTAAGAMDQWMNSAGHKANILNCTYVELGVGFAKGVNADYAGYWTQNFGKPL